MVFAFNEYIYIKYDIRKYAIFVSIFSFNRRVDVSVMAMGKLLYEVKGGGHGQAVSKSEVQAAADGILQVCIKKSFIGWPGIVVSLDSWI